MSVVGGLVSMLHSIYMVIFWFAFKGLFIDIDL